MKLFLKSILFVSSILLSCHLSASAFETHSDQLVDSQSVLFDQIEHPNRSTLQPIPETIKNMLNDIKSHLKGFEHKMMEIQAMNHSDPSRPLQFEENKVEYQNFKANLDDYIGKLKIVIDQSPDAHHLLLEYAYFKSRISTMLQQYQYLDKMRLSNPGRFVEPVFSEYDEMDDLLTHSNNMLWGAAIFDFGYELIHQLFED